MSLRASVRPRRSVLGLVLLLLLAGSAAAVDRREPASGALGERARRELAASGAVRGLYPGGSKRMWVTVRNHTTIDLRLVSLRGVAASDREGCPASAVKVRRLRGQPVVPARDRIAVRVRVRLRPSAPDACQGVRFPIVFQVQAVRA